MSVKLKFIIFQIVIIIPFLTGYFSGKYFKNSRDAAKKLIRINLFSLEPFIVFWSIWGLSLSLDQIFLPLSGLALVAAGFLIGKFIIAFPGNKKSSEKKTYIISSSLANHGFTMGGFICYLLIGEQGIGLSSIFMLYFLPYTFIFIFTYARTDSVKKLLNIRDFLSNYFTLQNMPLHAVTIAFILHLAGINRPDINIPLDALLIVSIGLYYFTLGLNFDFGSSSSNVREQLALSVTKFIILPLITFTVLHFFTLEHSVKTIILVMSFMPAAVYSVITSILFDLESKLASSLFVVNTLIFLILVLPAMFIFRGAIGF